MTKATFKQSYYRQLLPALVVVAAAAAVRSAGMAVAIYPDAAAKAVGASLFVAAIAAAAGLPVWIRAAFANRVRQAHGVDEAQFNGFQRRLMAVALIAPYLAAVVLAFQLDSFYQGGTVLAALYAIYYHYPSQRRIAFDRRLFRVGRPGPC